MITTKSEGKESNLHQWGVALWLSKGVLGGNGKVRIRQVSEAMRAFGLKIAQEDVEWGFLWEGSSRGSRGVRGADSQLNIGLVFSQ